MDTNVRAAIGSDQSPVIPSDAKSAGRYVSEALIAARELFGMQIAWIAEFRDDQKVFQAIDGDGESFGFAEGSAMPLDGSYCVRVARGDLPYVIPDTQAEPRVRDLEVTHSANIGSYVGVPIELDDGTIYGTLCCASHEANRDVSEADLRFLRTIARRVAREFEERRARAPRGRGA
jgi:GAF domain-containing protein